MKRGSIALARSMCEEIAGELEDGEQYGSVDVAEILSAEVERLRFVAPAQNAELLSDCEALFQWLDRRGGLGGEVHNKISGVMKRINTVLAATSTTTSREGKE